MPLISRTLLPRIRVQIPEYLSRSIPLIYLAMPPLPLSTMKPVQAAGLKLEKGAKDAIATISGTSNGGFEFAQSKKGTDGNRKNRRKSIVRYSKKPKYKSPSNTKAKAVQVSKRKSHLSVGRSKAGRFIKKGG